MRIPKIAWIILFVLILYHVTQPTSSEEEKVEKSFFIKKDKDIIVVYTKGFENPHFFTEKSSCSLIKQENSTFYLKCEGKYLYIKEGNEVFMRRIP